MGEFSMQLLYLFVYVLVICECLPVITEETKHENVYNNENSRHDRNIQTFTEMINQQPESGLEDSQLHDKGNSHLYNISKDLVHKIHTFTGNLINFLRTSIMAKSTNKDYTIKRVNTEDSENEDAQNITNTRVNLSSKSAENYQLTKSEHYTSSIAGYLDSEIHDRAKSKTNKHLQGHRKLRHKRSFFFDYEIGFENPFEDDGMDVIFGAHTSPCAARDRHYCLNGGTCVFLGALDIKTCRCSVGYTGLRCEMINQEYILALLSEEFFG